MTGSKRLVLLFCTFAFCFASTSAHAGPREAVAEKIEAYRQFFVRFQNTPGDAVPAKLLAECHGVILFTSYRAGFGLGAEVGGGVILMHDRRSGQWSAPAFIRSAGGNWGLQVGGQQTEAIILIMNEDGVKMLLKNRFSIGVDASVSAGPVGKDAGAAMTTKAALLTYAHARGLFAGAALGGGAMLNNDKMNKALYGRPISVRDIMDGKVQIPSEAYELIETLQSYTAPPQGRPQQLPPQEQFPEGNPQQQQWNPQPGSQEGTADMLQPQE